MKVLNFDSQQCARVRGQLDSYLSNELLVETTAEVVKHLENCDSCSRELEQRSRIREALRRAVHKQLPSESLRATIHQRLASAQPGVWGGIRMANWALALASVAVVLLAVVGGEQWLKVRHNRLLVNAVLGLGVSDHSQCAIKGHNYPDVASPPELLRKKLGPDYASLLPVVEEKLPNFEILEAHICRVSGSPREYVHFITRGQGTILSVILTRREGESLPVGRFLAARLPSGISLYKAQLEGFNVAGFESGGYFGFVVSDLKQESNTQLASSLAPALQSTLESGARTGGLEGTGVLIASRLSDGRFEHPMVCRDLQEEK